MIQIRKEQMIFVNAVKKGTGHPALVFYYRPLRATTFMCRVAVVSAWAGIHCGDEHEARRKVICCGGSRYTDVPVLQRLPQDLQRLPGKLRKLVQEQNAAVRQRHLARNGMSSAAEKPDGADCVVRSPERTSCHEFSAALGDSGDGMDARHL